MLFSGVWQLCDDEVVRPLIRGEILAGDGSWRAVELLLDTGAVEGPEDGAAEHDHYLYGTPKRRQGSDG